MDTTPNPDLQAKFADATAYLVHHSSKISEDILLQMYGYYKQATEGTCYTPKPSWYDYKAKMKWKAWKECEGMSKSMAMDHYIRCLSSAVQDWNTELNSNSYTVNGIAVSTMSSADEDVPENEKTVFDWVKEGSVEKLKMKNFDVHCTDDQGLTLLHWAADRGDLDIVRYLVEVKKANLNSRDGEGQTPLHYAAACGYSNIVQYLIEAGANFNIVDNNQCKPKEVAECEEISNLFP